MKKILLYTAALAGILFSSCAEDFLKQQPHQLSPDNYYESDDAVASLLIHSYNYVWYDFNDKFYYGMAMDVPTTSRHSTPTTSTLTPTSQRTLSQGLSEAWGSLYSVVSQSNNTINNLLTKCTSSVSETAKIQGIAEARFMRGLAYWYIGTLWGCGIIYTNTSDLVNNYVVPVSNLVRMSSSLPSETWKTLPRIFQQSRDKLVASTNTPHTVC